MHELAARPIDHIQRELERDVIVRTVVRKTRNGARVRFVVEKRHRVGHGSKEVGDRCLVDHRAPGLRRPHLIGLSLAQLEIIRHIRDGEDAMIDELGELAL